MIDTNQRRARLWARHHLDGSAAGVVDAVRAVVAMHSSDPLTPHLGGRARVAGYGPDALHAAFDDRTLWRLHAMRRTLWVIPADEAPIFDGAAAREVAVRERKRILGWVAAERDDAEAWVAALEDATVEAVRADPGTGTRALKIAVPELCQEITLGSGKWATRAAIAPRILWMLAMDGRLFRVAPAGTWRSSQYGWVATDGGYGARVAEAEARAALVRRYLARFGPVTSLDVKWWTGWTVARTKKALAAVGAVEVALEEGTGWVLPEDLEPAPSPTGVALLPGLDPTPMGWKDRSWYLGELGSALFDRNGNVGPTVWVDGHLVGGWAIRGDGTVATRLLADADPARVDAAAASLTAWLDGVSATPRFRTPLERELSA